MLEVELESRDGQWFYEIKLLKADLANDPNFESRFRQEAQASARMAHPTIVRVYDAGEDVTVDEIVLGDMCMEAFDGGLCCCCGGI